MAGEQQQGGGGKDNHMGFLWIIFGLFIFAAIIWYLFRAQIIQGIFVVKLAEISVISWFTDQLNSVRGWIHQADPAKVTMGQVNVIADAVGRYLRIPGALLLLGLAVVVYFTDIRLKFKRIYSMDTLASAERDNWPQITPVVSLNLVKEDIDHGKWAMALTPLQFVKKNKLIKLHKAESKQSYKARNLPPTMELIENKATTVFATQLGKPWTSIDNLTIHYRTLFAIFAARICRDRDGARQLLRQLAESTATGKLNFDGADLLLAKHRDNPIVTKITQSHAYELTVMASMLATARDDGVLAAAEFLWLKPVDRMLWYMLNNVGRRTAFCEVAGSYAHWLAEKAVGKKLRSPMVTEATRGLALALETIIYTDDNTTPALLLPTEEQVDEQLALTSSSTQKA